jgi:hypothetical protein
MQDLIDFIKVAFDKLFAYLLCPANYFLNFFADLVVDVVDGIPAIEFDNVVISPELSYMLDYFSFQPAFLMISAAWSVRFAIRRIPFFN